jgi:hypothetical protein
MENKKQKKKNTEEHHGFDLFFSCSLFVFSGDASSQVVFVDEFVPVGLINLCCRTLNQTLT